MRLLLGDRIFRPVKEGRHNSIAVRGMDGPMQVILERRDSDLFSVTQLMSVFWREEVGDGRSPSTVDHLVQRALWQ